MKLADWDGITSNVIINASMEEVLEKMKFKADLCVTSPPYSVGNIPTKGGDATKRVKTKNLKYDRVEDNFDEADYELWLNLILKKSQITFWNVPAKQLDRKFGVQGPHREPFGQVVWTKSNGSVPFDKNGVIYSHENIWVFGDQEKIIKPFNSVWSMPTQRLSKHPASFPIDLPARAIRHCTKPGDVVLDPFGGSGTTAAVAKAMGRRFITCDVSEQYVSWIEERVEKTKAM
jgi:DNA modification methylase